MAGKGGGRRDVEHVIACSMEIAAGNDTRAEHAANCEDPRSILVVEPLRWAVALRPEWIALEQVPPVLELWSLYAQILGSLGYSAWAGVLEAERYGVPQTRERAILIARRDGKAAHPPGPTHQRYVPGEPQRHDVTMFGEVLPWVSMAEALGWEEGPSPSPSPSVTGGGGATGGVEVFASKAARERAANAVRLRMTKMPNSAERSGDEPAPTMAFGNDSASARWLRAGTNANDIARPANEPAPTLRFGARSNDVSRVPESTRALQSDDWPATRPATTVNADGDRVFQPGGHHTPGSQSKNAVRVTVQEAAILQSFRPDYPWQGSRTKQFEQVGNAVPPLLAKAVLSVLVDPVGLRDAA